ncbi:hypothetical protein ES707_12675 [subsurface metagenome]
MLKVKVNCPICGDLIGARSLEGHLENVHELTGAVTLRLNPTHPYAHEPEPEPEPKGGSCEEKPEHEPKHEPEVEPAAEPEVEPAAEPEPEVEPEPVDD